MKSNGGGNRRRVHGNIPDRLAQLHLQKQLNRASKLLRDVFLLWREITWTREINHLSRYGALVLFGCRTSDRATDAPFLRFPEEHFVKKLGREALLSYCACVEAQVYFVELTKKLFKDIATNIECVDLNVAEGSYIITEKGDGTHFIHTVLALDTPDKKSYIVDLSGAQLELQTAIMPLEAYFCRFTASVSAVYDHAYAYARFKKDLAEDDETSRVCSTLWKMHEGLHQAAEQWEKDHRTTVAEILALPNKKYRQQMRGLYRSLESGLRASFYEREVLGHPRATRQSLGVALTSEEKDVLRRPTLSLDPAEGELSGIRVQWAKDIDSGAAGSAGQEIEE